jgi:hypothetical protein
MEADGAAAQYAGLRRHDEGSLHRVPRSHEYAVAGAGAIERCAVCGGRSGTVGAAFLRLVGREPDVMEQNLLRDLYHEQRELFLDTTQQDASKFIELGETPPDAELDPKHLAALTVVCQAILNLDAAIYER